MLNADMITKNMESLQQDATRMAKDISRLHHDLAKTSRKNGQRLASQLGQQVSDGLESVGSALGETFSDVGDSVGRRVGRLQKTARGQIRVLDKRVHTRPFGYYFIGGALAVGFIGGIVLALGAKKD